MALAFRWLSPIVFDFMLCIYFAHNWSAFVALKDCFKDTEVLCWHEYSVSLQPTYSIVCFVICADFYLPTEHLHSVPAASPGASANPHISVYADDGH